MISQEYSEAIAETLDILNHTNKNDVNKIPEKFMNFLKENSSKTYKVFVSELDEHAKKTYKANLDYTKKIQDMNLREKTIGILSIINKKYWCSEEERKKFETKLKDNEIEYQNKLREKYNQNNIFNSENTRPDSLNKEYFEEKSIVEYKEKSFLQKIFEKIRTLFRK